MRLLFVSLVLVTTQAAVAGPKPGDEGTPEFDRAAELVKRLGNPRVAIKEAAATQLVAMGHAAIPALRQGAKANDEEVRSRSAALLPQVKAAGWKRLADALLTKPDEKHDLPLLTDWDKLMGKPDAATRKVFAAMLLADGDFLEQVAADRLRTADLGDARCIALFRQVHSTEGQRQAQVGNFAAVLFVDALSPSRRWTSENAPPYLLRNPGLVEALDDKEAGPGFRRLLIRWFESQPDGNPVPKTLFPEFARTKAFPEAVPILAGLAKEARDRPLVIRMLAIEALATAGSKDAAAALAGFVPDSTVVLQVKGAAGPESVRFGDQALAASLTLHGKKAADYGMSGIKMRFFPQLGRYELPITVYTFPSDEARAAAVRKWDAVVAAKGGANATGLAAHPATAPAPSGPPVPPLVQPTDRIVPGKPIVVSTGHPRSIGALTFSPNGAELATACGRPDPRVRFWDARTGRLTRTLEAHAVGTTAIAYTPDGTRLLTASFWDKDDVTVWDARTHAKLMDLKGHRHGAARLAVSPDGKRLVSLGLFNSIDDVVVWDLDKGRLQNRHPTLATSVHLTEFLPDGRTLLVSNTQQLRLWDTGAAGAGVRDLGDVRVPGPGAKGQPPDGRVSGGAAFGLGGRIALVGVARTGRLVEVLTGQDIWQLPDGSFGYGTAISPDGRTLARPAVGGIELLDVPSETTILTLQGHTRSAYKMAFSPDGRRLASVGAHPENTTLLLWDLRDVAARPLPRSSPGPGDLERWCAALADLDARAAYQAVWRLAGASDQAVPRLKSMIDDRLRTTPADITRWIGELDHDRFAVRESAAARLTAAGSEAVGAMEAALRAGGSAEQRRRLQAILNAIRELPVPPDRLFAARARLALEQIGSPDARKVLDEWARDSRERDRAAEARASAERVTKQAGRRP